MTIRDGRVHTTANAPLHIQKHNLLQRLPPLKENMSHKKTAFLNKIPHDSGVERDRMSGLEKRARRRTRNPDKSAGKQETAFITINNDRNKHQPGRVSLMQRRL